jgi:hypothetical protein
MNIQEIKKLNKDIGHHFFDLDTMRFFASKVESKLFSNGTFITSEKKCFEDNTRVFAIRQAKYVTNPISGDKTFTGEIETLEKGIESLEQAKININNY